MKKKVFWIGVAVLVVGIVLFGYGYITIQNILAMHPQMPQFFNEDYYAEVKQKWNLAHILQPIGFGMLVLGAIMLAYGILVKE